MGSRSHVFGVLDEMKSDTILIDTRSNDEVGQWLFQTKNTYLVQSETWEYSRSVRFELGQFCLKKKSRELVGKS